MPIVIRCPSCERRLRVPDELLGRTVKCPTCKATFTATEEGTPTQPPATPPEEAPPEERRPRRRPAAEEEEDEERPSRRRPPAEEEEDEERPSRPARRRPRPGEEEAEYEEGYEEEYEERPRRRRRAARTEAARAAVAGPAIALMVVGIIILVLAPISLVVNLISLVNPPPAAKAGGVDPTFNAGFGVGGAILGICWGGIVTVGALKMKNLQSRGAAMTACITALLPCCCGLGIPFGIWGLVVLNRPEVRDAFLS